MILPVPGFLAQHLDHHYFHFAVGAGFLSFAYPRWARPSISLTLGRSGARGRHSGGRCTVAIENINGIWNRAREGFMSPPFSMAAQQIAARVGVDAMHLRGVHPDVPTDGRIEILVRTVGRSRGLRDVSLVCIIANLGCRHWPVYWLRAHVDTSIKAASTHFFVRWQHGFEQRFGAFPPGLYHLLLRACAVAGC